MSVFSVGRVPNGVNCVLGPLARTNGNWAYKGRNCYNKQQTGFRRRDEEFKDFPRQSGPIAALNSVTRVCILSQPMISGAAGPPRVPRHNGPFLRIALSRANGSQP